MKKCDCCGRVNSNEQEQCIECGCDRFKVTAVADTQVLKAARKPFLFRPLPAEEMEKSLVTVSTCRTLMDADMLLAELEGIGISAFIPDKYLMQEVGFNLGTYGFVRVQVAPNDYRETMEYLWERDQQGTLSALE
jgi:hypothetical protein